MTFISRFIFIILLQFFSCNGDNEVKITELIVINEMQSCSENNMFYKIIYASDSNYLKSERDSIVLLLFSDSLATEKNYHLFFPAFSDQRYEFQVRGFFLKERVETGYSYGCPGSNKFRITEILKTHNVSSEKQYKIDNK